MEKEINYRTSEGSAFINISVEKCFLLKLHHKIMDSYKHMKSSDYPLIAWVTRKMDDWLKSQNHPILFLCHTLDSLSSGNRENLDELH